MKLIDKMDVVKEIEFIERLLRLPLQSECEGTDKVPRFNAVVNMLACSVISDIYSKLFSEVKEAEKLVGVNRYKLFLTHVGERKIECIKQVRIATSLGLREAKEFCESPLPKEMTPFVCKRGLDQYPNDETALQLVKTFADVGATLVMTKHEGD